MRWGYLYESFSAVGFLPRLPTSRRYPLRNSYANRHGGIYDLRNVLILHIVSYIKNHSTLHNLSLVSITFNGISTASLYHTYKNRESEETNALLDGLSLRSFLRLILTNSRLASLAKKSIWDYGRLGSMSSPFIFIIHFSRSSFP